MQYAHPWHSRGRVKVPNSTDTPPKERTRKPMQWDCFGIDKAGGHSMAHVMESREGTIVATDGLVAARRPRLITTFYELFTALHAVVGPEGDALVVATVQHLLQSGRLTWYGEACGHGARRPAARHARPRSAPQYHY